MKGINIEETGSEVSEPCSISLSLMRLKSTATEDEYRSSFYTGVEGESNPSFYPQRDYRANVIVQKDNLTTSYTPNQYLN